MYKCKVCGKEFVFSDPNLVDRIKKQRLKAHETRCQKNKEVEKFQCKHCGMEIQDEKVPKYIKRGRISTHEKSCKGVEVFQCRQCGKVYDDEEMPKFQKRQSLSRHEETCKGLEKFQCEHCGKENDDQDIPIHEKKG